MVTKVDFPPVVAPEAGVGEGLEDRHFAIVHLDVIELTHLIKMENRTAV